MLDYNYPSKNADRYMAFKIEGEWKWFFAKEHTSHSDMSMKVEADSESQITYQFGGFFCFAYANAKKSIKKTLRKEELLLKEDNCTKLEDEELDNIDTNSKNSLMLFGISDSFPIDDKEMFEEAVQSLKKSYGNTRVIVIDDFDELK